MKTKTRKNSSRPIWKAHSRELPLLVLESAIELPRENHNKESHTSVKLETTIVMRKTENTEMHNSSTVVTKAI